MARFGLAWGRRDWQLSLPISGDSKMMGRWGSVHRNSQQQSLCSFKKWLTKPLKNHLKKKAPSLAKGSWKRKSVMPPWMKMASQSVSLHPSPKLLCPPKQKTKAKKRRKVKKAPKKPCQKEASPCQKEASPWQKEKMQKPCQKKRQDLSSPSSGGGLGRPCTHAAVHGKRMITWKVPWVSKGQLQLPFPCQKEPLPCPKEKQPRKKVRRQHLGPGPLGWS